MCLRKCYVLAGRLRLTFDLSFDLLRITVVCAILFFLNSFSFLFKRVFRCVYVSTHTATLAHALTLADTQQLNWVIRAIYIIMQASGCFNGVVCGNVLVGTAVRSHSSCIYIYIYILSDVKPKSRQRLQVFGLQLVY